MGETPRQSYGVSLAIWDHTVLPVTRHKRTCPAITPARQVGTWFTYHGGIAAWPGIEPTTSRSQVRRPNHYATESPLSVVLVWQCCHQFFSVCAHKPVPSSFQLLNNSLLTIVSGQRIYMILCKHLYEDLIAQTANMQAYWVAWWHNS